jgi:hypothetical protein
LVKIKASINIAIMNKETSRRRFLSNSTKIIAGTSVASLFSAPVIASAKNKILGANEKIVVGLVGAKGMGFADLSDFLKQPNVECAAICDIDDSILDERIATVEKGQDKAPQRYKDFRKLIDNKDIDVVIVGTPDHWHCLPTVYALQAGKDVYVEKPLANSIAECELNGKSGAEVQPHCSGRTTTTQR